MTGSRIGRTPWAGLAGRRRRAFTLLEVLVTVLVSSVLLMTLWTLLDMYSRLFDAGQTKAGQTQLMSGLMRQLSDDLCSAIQDTAEAPPGTLGPVRRFGMFGSSHSLQFDILQATPARGSATNPVAPPSSLDEPLAAEAYELRTVRYEFVPMTDPTQIDTSSRPGLTRHELDFKSTSDSQMPDSDMASSDLGAGDDSGSALAEQPQEGPAFDMQAADTTDSSALMDSLAPDPNDNTVTWVPEVVAFEFRYFDGLVWNSSWNSLERKSLPAAVEIVMELSPTEGLSLPKSEPEASSSSDETTSDEMDFMGLEHETVRPGALGCRMVVDLPTSALRNVFDKQRDDFLLPGNTGNAQPDMDAMMDDLFDVDEPVYALTDEPAPSAGRRSRFGRVFDSNRTVIQQKAPDQWMRGLH